jgi:Bacterial type II/III secretion system short domain
VSGDVMKIALMADKLRSAGGTASKPTVNNSGVIWRLSMKLRATELFISLLLAFTIANANAFAQSDSAQQRVERKPAADAPKFSVRLFEIKYQSPNNLREALNALGSGAPGSTMTPNNQLRTLTVRDFPENITAIEEALKRLDVPGKSPISLECQLHLLSASMRESDKSQMAKNLEPVVTQLRSTLQFTNYRYISSSLNRVSDGGDVESSGIIGILFPTPSGVINTPENPTFYRYSIKGIKLTQDASGKETIQISQFNFGSSVPVKTGGNNIQYKDCGMTTPLTLREGEMAAVGMVNISSSDDAIIVIVSVKKMK